MKRKQSKREKGKKEVIKGKRKQGRSQTRKDDDDESWLVWW
jgi:hypothetical protein